jgi:hypothetical protein
VRRRPRAAVAMAVESHKTPEAARASMEALPCLLLVLSRKTAPFTVGHTEHVGLTDPS